MGNMKKRNGQLEQYNIIWTKYESENTVELTNGNAERWARHGEQTDRIVLQLYTSMQ